MTDCGDCGLCSYFSQLSWDQSATEPPQHYVEGERAGRNGDRTSVNDDGVTDTGAGGPAVAPGYCYAGRRMTSMTQNELPTNSI